MRLFETDRVKKKKKIANIIHLNKYMKLIYFLVHNIILMILFHGNLDRPGKKFSFFFAFHKNSPVHVILCNILNYFQKQEERIVFNKGPLTLLVCLFVGTLGLDVKVYKVSDIVFIVCFFVFRYLICHVLQ